MATDDSALPTRLLTPEQAMTLQEAIDPRLSPSGRLAAFCAGPVSKAGEPHAITERAHQLDLIRRVLAWFDTYLAPPGTSPAGDQNATNRCESLPR